MTVLTAPASAPPAYAGAPARGRGNPRNAELRLILLAMIVVAGFAAVVEMHLLETLTSNFWVPAAVLGAVFIAANIALRFLAPYADPVLLPAVALLNGIGVSFLRRLDLGVPSLGQPGTDAPIFSDTGGLQLIWTLVAVVAGAVLIAVVRDHRVISHYAWTLGLVGLVLMTLPGLLPASISASEYDQAAKLWIRIGPLSVQPGEFAKLALLGFFAYYLVRKREVLSLASRRVLGIDLPRGRDMGPVVVVWVLSMMVLVMQFDLGMSLLYLGMFVSMLYIATERVSWLLIGLLMFGGGAVLAYLLGRTVGGPFANLTARVDIWLDPFSDPDGAGFQPVQALLGLGTGGLFGTGPGGGQPGQIPIVNNDFIFAGLGEEIGLFGLTAMLVILLLVVTRGIKAGLAVRDSFGKLLAGGLAFTLGLQIFVILGGVTGLIPLTGLTTPFMSAGGSALVANWMLVFMLLRISDSARRPPPTGGGLRIPPPAPASVSPAPSGPPASTPEPETVAIRTTPEPEASSSEAQTEALPPPRGVAD